MAWILLIGLAARVGFAAYQGLNAAPVPGTDQSEYDAYAWNVVRGNGYAGPSPDVADQSHPTAYRPRLPSLLMAGCTRPSATGTRRSGSSAALVWHKFVRSWSPVPERNPSSLTRTLYLLSWGPVLVLFAAAFVPTLVGSLRGRTPAWLLHAAIIHYVLNSVIFFANIRYRAPVDPLCLVLAAWVVVRLTTGGAPVPESQGVTGASRSPMAARG